MPDIPPFQIRGYRDERSRSATHKSNHQKQADARPINISKRYITEECNNCSHEVRPWHIQYGNLRVEIYPFQRP